MLLRKEDTLMGLSSDPGREISRDLVAKLSLQALLQPGAANRVVEAVQESSTSYVEPDPLELFFAIRD